MNRLGTCVLVGLLIVALVAAVHAENADSGYQNVICKTIIVPAAPAAGEYSEAGRQPINGTLLAEDIPDPKKVPGVDYIFSPEIITLSSSVGR